ncbi:putative transporter YisQ [Clostridia bacterium]|nr:putative transporter YisQ [Clostridia bacterium]
MTLSNINVLMLGKYSDRAVAAVGVSAQIVNMVLTLYIIVSMGTGIIISQYRGAGEGKSASLSASLSILTNLGFGIAVSLLMILLGERLLLLIHIPPELMDDASAYIRIAGGASFIQALIVTLSAIARNYGITKFPMYVALAMNLINILGNYAVLYRPFGIPSYGVAGVAVSLAISTFIGLCLMVYLFARNLKEIFNFNNLLPFPKDMFIRIIKIGAPAAAESMSYNATQTVTTFIITFIGTAAIATRIYVQSISSFVTILGLGIGQGTAIMIGYLVGAGKPDEANSICLKSLKIAVLANAAVSLLLLAVSGYLFRFYTHDAEILRLAEIVMIIEVFVQIGRAPNHVLANALRAAGDVRYTMLTSVTSMWGVSVALCYCLGIVFGWKLPGIWIAFAADEWVRGSMLLRRWLSGKWAQKKLVESELHP